MPYRSGRIGQRQHRPDIKPTFALGMKITAPRGMQPVFDCDSLKSAGVLIGVAARDHLDGLATDDLKFINQGPVANRAQPIAGRVGKHATPPEARIAVTA